MLTLAAAPSIGGMRSVPPMDALRPGEVSVTPHKPAKFGQTAYPDRFARLDPEPFFCDWLSISQVHNWDLPLVDNGLVMSVRKDGSLDWETRKPVQFEGSHDSSLRISCDGHRVRLSGNLSRFGRPDNVFGLSLAGCIRKASDIAAKFGLPPFTAGQLQPVFRKRNDGTVSADLEYNGARISRIDLTANYSAGSMDDARAYMKWLGSQQHSRRIKVGTYDDETVDWGRGSRRLYAKAYLKSPQLARFNGPDALVGYCDSIGMIRYELTVKATQLQSMGCHTLGGLHMGRLIELFENRQSVMTRATADVDDLAELPRALRVTARDYLAGDNLMATMSERSFRRHRAALLKYGIDIAVPSGVVAFRPRVRVIELGPVEVPDWYQLESRYAA